VFGDHDRMPSALLVAKLRELETSPWADWGKGKGLTTNQLGRLLGTDRFRIEPRTIKCNADAIREVEDATQRTVKGNTLKGYLRESFDDAFGRYLPALLPARSLSPTFEPSPPSPSSVYTGKTHFFETSPAPLVTDAKNPLSARKHCTVTLVTDQNPEQGGLQEEAPRIQVEL
jgi:hypothetical protein